MATEPELRIEPLGRHHASVLYGSLCDDRIYRFIDEEPPASLDALERRYAFLEGGAPEGVDETWLNWAVVDRSTARIVGTVQATVPADPDTPTSIAYVVVPAEWGRGIGRRSVELMLAELAGDHGVLVTQAEIHADNLRSVHLAEELGFAHVDTVVEGDHDELIYQRAADRDPVAR
jgi:RimJ/RimL family protein N-acetyltransferase